MTIREYIKDNCHIDHDAVIAYYENDPSINDIDIDFEYDDEKGAGEFDTAEDYDMYYEEIDLQKEYADELIEKAEENYQCDDDTFEDMINELYIDPCIEGAADTDTIYRYFDYDRFRNDLLMDNYFYSNGYYFLAY